MNPILQTYKKVCVQPNFVKFQDRFNWFRLVLNFCTKNRYQYSFSTLSNKESMNASFLAVEESSYEANFNTGVKWKQFHKNLKKDFIYIIKKVHKLKVYVDPSISNQLCNVFETDDVSHIVKYPRLKLCDRHELSRTILFWQQHKIKLTHLKMAPWLLWQTEDELKRKEKLIKKLGLFENIVDGLGFLLFPTGLIEKYNMLFDSESSLFPFSRNRIYYICDKLNLPVDLFTIRSVSAWLILHRQKQKIDEVIDVLLEYGIDPKNIVDDPWIFFHSSKKITERLKRVSNISSIPPKLWVCRCDPELFESFCLKFDPISKSAFNNDIPMIFQEIAAELDCDLPKVEHALKSKSQRESSILKMRRNLERLKQFGFTNKQIRRNLLVLKYDSNVIKRRLELLKALDVAPKNLESLTVLIKISEFEKFYKMCKLEHDFNMDLQVKKPKGSPLIPVIAET